MFAVLHDAQSLSFGAETVEVLMVAVGKGLSPDEPSPNAASSAAVQAVCTWATATPVQQMAAVLEGGECNGNVPRTSDAWQAACARAFARALIPQLATFAKGPGSSAQHCDPHW